MTDYQVERAIDALERIARALEQANGVSIQGLQTVGTLAEYIGAYESGDD